MVGYAEIIAAAALLLTLGAEFLHAMRVAKVAPLAFGPKGKPAFWVGVVPFARALAAGALAWGLFTLMTIEPKVYKAKTLEDDDLQHIVIVLDVSPSMKIQDAGVDGKLSRRRRGFELMESFFKRVAMEQMRLSLVAVYSSAKPVVVDTKDTDVIRNFLDGVDMDAAFDTGKTQLFSGLEEAAKVAEDWKRGSTTIVLISDGDTVPATGMPKMPQSVKGIIVVGVGDPRTGTFIDGRNSKQDVSTLRQIALRLGGSYHDGNEKHLASDTILALTAIEKESPFEKLTRREYALMACGIGALILALLPLLLARFGSRWRPGRRSA